MTSQTPFTEIAALAGDPTRAGMLHALLDGRALTASELARVAGVTPQTASGHLARLSAAGLVRVAKQGRHRYHRLASPAVAQMMESIMQVAADARVPQRPISVGPRDQALRAARTCYDHLAGTLAVRIADALVGAGHVELSDDSGLVTESGSELFRRLGINVEALGDGKRGARLLCRPCLDWTERRPHIAGRLGTALCAHCFAHGWIRRVEGTRAVSVTPHGRREFRAAFGVAGD
jgi:DNA-binding transcriptional ArsR family regulator